MEQVLSNTEFGDYYWHDSEIRSIEIDRREPGKNDTILFNIDWYDKGSGILVFEDVYWARLNLNFGVVAAECIDCAFIANSNDVDLINFNQIWKDKLPDLVLTCFVIKTSSTGTEIKIIAKNFNVTV